AGRASSTGKVLIQTHQPDHPLMRVLIAEGYNSFAVQLLAERKHSGLPPYGYSALIRSESKRPENALAILQLIHGAIKNTGSKHNITT
ncbi:primosomal protein N', partial [Gilvimarinus sp. 1_MG-2023]|nr:primosomal protein N' [Gilvimarinus sp. 1_MG-2023]